MARYFTSDWHLNSESIIKHAHRPFGDSEEMGKHFLNSLTDIRDEHPTVFHVGDFILSGYDRHGKDVDSDVGKLPFNYWHSTATSCGVNLVMLAGNHDNGHNCEADCNSMVIDLNQHYKNVSVGHFPSNSEVKVESRSGRKTISRQQVVGYKGWNGRGNRIHIHLCGHVHDKWLMSFDAERMVLNVNVGVDVWDYKPVRDSEITKLLDYFRVTLWTKINPSYGKWTNFVLTRQAFDQFKIAHSAEAKAQRELRKAEKLAKKGLTPEECERRRIEAMKKKGLL